MRQDPEFFGDQEMDLLYIAKKLKESLAVEDALTAAGVDYAVEVDQYLGGFIFKRQRAGAFFYVLPDVLAQARQVLQSAGYQPQEL